MSGIAQIDRILSEVNELEEKEKILFFHRIKELFDIVAVKQDEDISMESAFGLWKGRNITKEDLRKKSWSKQ